VIAPRGWFLVGWLFLLLGMFVLGLFLDERLGPYSPVNRFLAFPLEAIAVIFAYFWFGRLQFGTDD
jgi:hypothetical protein